MTGGTVMTGGIVMTVFVRLFHQYFVRHNDDGIYVRTRITYTTLIRNYLIYLYCYV
jgi:hypothetical protein